MRVFFFFILICFISCSGPPNQEQPTENISIQQAVLPDTSETTQLTGKVLAQTYCKACHAFPDPNLLDKVTWKNKVLPQMALRLGLNTNANINPFVGKSQEEIYDLVKAGIYPQTPYINPKDWQKIVNYYEQNAPTALPLSQLYKIKPDLENFSIIIPGLNKGKAALTTLTKYDKKAAELWVGNLRNWLFQLNQNLEVVDSVQINSPPVDIIKDQIGYKVVAIGSIIPTDKKTGQLYQIPVKGKSKSTQILFSELHRPVDIVEADLNQDKLPDLVVCNYGYNFGSLVWYQNKGANQYKAILLKDLSGARKTEIVDLNQDGRPDVVALFAQGTETIKVFYNQGSENFEEQNLIQLPPVYGTNYFELADFNKDGFQDIMVVSGDNADFSFILKPYHCIRIFLNNGKNQFSQKYFYQMPGAWKAVARDFDLDGDLDIAAISFFPDYNRIPERSFVYLEQKQHLEFEASTFAQSQVGRWFTLEAADYDNDGDEDIILGSFTNALTPVPADLQNKWIGSSPSILVLQNRKTNKPVNLVKAK